MYNVYKSTMIFCPPGSIGKVPDRYRETDRTMQLYSSEYGLHIYVYHTALLRLKSLEIALKYKNYSYTYEPDFIITLNVQSLVY